jgi:hypothetical protein
MGSNVRVGSTPIFATKTNKMKNLKEIKNGKYFTDDNGLMILWQPILDKVRDPNGIISYRNSQENTPIGLFRLLSNKYNYESEVKFDDGEGEIILLVNKLSATIKN